MTCETCKKDDVLYEDEFVKITHGDAVEGHLEVFPKQHIPSFQDLNPEEAARYFFTSSFAATVVFESLEAQGTNIIFHSNPDTPHLKADIVPRSFEDGIDVQWQPIELTPDEFSEIAERIRNAGAEDRAQKQGEKQKPLKPKSTLDQEDYRVKHWDRLP